MQTPHPFRNPRVAVLLLASTLACPFAPLANDITVGDSADRVREVLGEPRGSIHSGSYEMFQYDRGRVELRDGVVTNLELVTAEEAAVLKIERERQARELKERQAAQREQRRLEGLEIRDRALNNPDFLASSGTRQVEFWEDFHRRYPDVPVHAEYTAAAAKRDADREKAETERRLADMEKRVSDAEARAKEAEENAKDAQRDARDARRRVVYYPPYYGYPVYTPSTNQSTYRPTYPTTVYPYSHGYSYWSTPTTVRPANSCATTTFGSSSGLRVNVSY